MKKGPGRPNLGKTKTIRQRAVTIYLPTEEMLEYWKVKAKEYGAPLSRFLVEIADDAIRRKPSGLTPREELERDLMYAKIDMRKLQVELKSAETALRERDATVAEYRAELGRQASGPVAEGDALDKLPDLLAYFRQHDTLTMLIPWKEFRIRTDQTAAVQSLKDSLAFLVRHGVVQKRITDWRWVGGKSRDDRLSAKK